MEKRITIKDISKRTGVSATTVAKALNGKDKISEKKRQEILKVAEELGYKPNRFASALARNEIAIGIIIPKEPVVFFSSVISGINDAINARVDERVRGIFCYLKEDSGNLDQQLEELFSNNLSALIISPGMFFKDNLILEKYLKGRPDMHVLYLLNEIDAFPAPSCVRMNGVAAGRIACEVLSMNMRERGKVAVLTEDNSVQIHRECVTGFLQEAEALHIEVAEVDEMFDRYELAYRETKQLVERYEDLCGIYVSSYKCTPVCNCLHDMGKTAQVAVVAHDIYEESVWRMRQNQLRALIFQNPYEQGRCAVEKICKLILENVPLEENIVLPQLVLPSALDYYVEKYMESKECTAI